MRFTLYAANAHLINELYAVGAISEVLHNGFDIVLARLHDGAQVAFHFMERDIDVGLIQQILDQNSAKQIHTLFILWGAMLLPNNGELYPPYDWMLALLTLYEDRIYGFDAEGPQAWIFPVHFHPQDQGIHRLIEYGEVVNFAHLRAETVIADGQNLRGRCRIAHFEAPRASAHQDHTDAPKGHRRFESGVIHTTRESFRILGVSSDADLETVRKAYRALAREFHPDVNPDAAANQQMQAINLAYARIMRLFDPE